MVKVIDNEIKMPGERWIIEMTKDELKSKRCRICKKKIKEFQEVLYCDLCKSIIHNDCFRDNPKLLCRHSLYEEATNWAGKVSLNGK